MLVRRIDRHSRYVPSLLCLPLVLIRPTGKGNHQQAGTIFGTIGIIRGLAAIIGPIISGSLISYSTAHSPTSPASPSSPEQGGWEVMGKYGYGKFVVFLGVVSVGTAGLILGIPAVDRWRKAKRDR